MIFDVTDGFAELHHALIWTQLLEILETEVQFRDPPTSPSFPGSQFRGHILRGADERGHADAGRVGNRFQPLHFVGRHPVWFAIFWICEPASMTERPKLTTACTVNGAGDDPAICFTTRPYPQMTWSRFWFLR